MTALIPSVLYIRNQKVLTYAELFAGIPDSLRDCHFVENLRSCQVRYQTGLLSVDGQIVTTGHESGLYPPLGMFDDSVTRVCGLMPAVPANPLLASGDPEVEVVLCLAVFGQARELRPPGPSSILHWAKAKAPTGGPVHYDEALVKIRTFGVFEENFSYLTNDLYTAVPLPAWSAARMTAAIAPRPATPPPPPVEPLSYPEPPVAEAQFRDYNGMPRGTPPRVEPAPPPPVVPPLDENDAQALAMKRMKTMFSMF